MKQSVFTVVADISAGDVVAVREALAPVRVDPGGNAVLPLAGFDTLHFASLVIADGPDVDPPKLIFECNVDGTAEEWLATLVAQRAGGLDTVYAHSPGYPGSADPGALRAWLAARVVRPGAYHIGATGRSLQRICREQELHEAIGAFLDAEEAAGRLADATPGETRARVQAFVRAEPALAWAEDRAPAREPRADWLRARAMAVAVAVAALLASPVLVPVLLVWAAGLRMKELNDKVQEGPPAPEHVRLLEDDEDEFFVAQNHLSSVIPVKPGFLRSVTIRVVLFAVNLVARITSTKGKLGGIPSIHFAHWSLVDDGRHLVFLSNFDGSWESYLGDFIDKAAAGLTAVWSNTDRFPRTRFLIRQGATDGPRFRQWARASQCRTEAWYTAYERLGMSVIDNNSSIREDLFTSLGAEETERWLRRL